MDNHPIATYWAQRLRQVIAWSDELGAAKEITPLLQMKHVQVMQEIHRIHEFLAGLELLLGDEKFGSLTDQLMKNEASIGVKKAETMIMQQPVPGLPPIKAGSIHIESTRSEEYYGIEGKFAWETPIAEEERERLQDTIRQERNAAYDAVNKRWEAQRRQGDRTMPRIVRGDYAEQGLVLAFLAAIRSSSEWRAFYAKKNRAGRITYGPLDGTGERHGNIVTPEFDDTRIHALQGITFTTEGGEFSFETRDA